MITVARGPGFLAHTVLLTGLFALLVLWAGPEQMSFVGTPKPTADRGVMMGEWAQASIDEQLAVLGCDKRQRLTAQVAVRNAAKDRAGNHQFDTLVVRKVSLEQGLADAAAGKVWTVGWCG